MPRSRRSSFDSTKCGKSSQSRDHRQPEVRDPVGEDPDERGCERDPDPPECKRQQCFDDPSSSQGERSARDRVAGGVSDDQLRDRRRPHLEGVQSRPEAGNVAQPIEEDPDEGEPVAAGRAGKLEDELERAECVSHACAPAAPTGELVFEPERSQRDSSPDRHADDPRPGQAAADRQVADEHDHSRDQCRRRKHAGFELAESQYPRTGIGFRQTGPLQRLPVEREAAGSQENTETGRD